MGRWVGPRREKTGEVAVWILVASALLRVFDLWQRLDFAVGHRSAFLTVGNAALRVLFSPVLHYLAFVLAGMFLVGLHFYDKRQRRKSGGSVEFTVLDSEGNPKPPKTFWARVLRRRNKGSRTPERSAPSQASPKVVPTASRPVVKPDPATSPPQHWPLVASHSEWDGKVFLTVRGVGSGFFLGGAMLCAVKDPLGVSTTSKETWGIHMNSSQAKWDVTYPDDFVDASGPLIPGKYLVLWQSAGTLDVPRSVRDSFEIKRGSQ